MSDLWITAGEDAEAALHLRYLTHARTAAASSIAFVLGAQEPDDFTHRAALVSGALDEACEAAVGPDTNRFLDVRVALLTEVEESFNTVHEARQVEARRKEAAAAERKAAERKAALSAQFFKVAGMFDGPEDYGSGNGDLGSPFYVTYKCPKCGTVGSSRIANDAAGLPICHKCGNDVPPEAITRGRDAARRTAKSASEGESDGAAAFRAGQPRIAPFAEDGTDVGSGYADYARGWYRGWDRANLAEPVGGGGDDDALKGGSTLTAAKTAYSTWSEDDDEFDDDVDEDRLAAEACPVCGGEGQLMGILGRTGHYRCRDCGWTYSITAQDDGHYPTADDLSFESAKTATDTLDASGTTTQLPVDNGTSGASGMAAGTDIGGGGDDSPDNPYGITAARKTADWAGETVRINTYPGLSEDKYVETTQVGDYDLQVVFGVGSWLWAVYGSGSGNEVASGSAASLSEAKAAAEAAVPTQTAGQMGLFAKKTASNLWEPASVDPDYSAANAEFHDARDNILNVKRMYGEHGPEVQKAEDRFRRACERMDEIMSRSSAKTAAVSEECANCGHAIDVDGGVWYHVRTGLAECQDHIPAPPTDAATPSRSGRES